MDLMSYDCHCIFVHLTPDFLIWNAVKSQKWIRQLASGGETCDLRIALTEAFIGIQHEDHVRVVCLLVFDEGKHVLDKCFPWIGATLRLFTEQ